ncbi:unnamed protein product [Taenia asiatica]|uniref:Uncharacterized protein n=1 Tax=Taenia asiatica TaxID=60517 RepID=A0A3P6QV30_TAEAS|nr:unnamed protein product [Taenia asiatica]
MRSVGRPSDVGYGQSGLLLGILSRPSTPSPAGSAPNAIAPPFLVTAHVEPPSAPPPTG